MRKLFAFMLAAVVAVSLFSAFAVSGSAYYDEVGGYYVYNQGGGKYLYYKYDLNENIIITGCNADYCDYSQSLTIPAYIDERPVCGIGYGAFYGMEFTAVTLPETMSSIDAAAFQSAGLSSIYIPRNVSNISSAAFTGCGNLKSITVDKDNSYYCTKNNCLISSGGNLILGCVNSSIPSDGSVNAIADFAFSGLSGLKHIDIPEGVTYIGFQAFYETGLTSVNIPASVDYIGEGAFGHCPVTSVTVAKGNGVYWSENNCLMEKSTDTDTHRTVYKLILGVDPTKIPADGSIDEICDYAFCNKSLNIKKVIIPDGVTRIGFMAFCVASSYDEVYLPASVTEIGFSAFDSDLVNDEYVGKSVKKVYYGGTEQQWKNIDISEGNNGLVSAERTYSYKQPSATAMLGDINGDGEIKLADAMSVFKYVAKVETLTAAQLKLSDCNKDGEVKLADAMAIFKYVAKVSVQVKF